MCCTVIQLELVCAYLTGGVTEGLHCSLFEYGFTWLQPCEFHQISQPHRSIF